MHCGLTRWLKKADEGPVTTVSSGQQQRWHPHGGPDSDKLWSAHDTGQVILQRPRSPKTPAKRATSARNARLAGGSTQPSNATCTRNRQPGMCLFFGQCRFCRFWAWQRVCGLYHSDVDIEMTHGDVEIDGVGREVGAVSALLQAQGCSEF